MQISIHRQISKAVHGLPPHPRVRRLRLVDLDQLVDCFTGLIFRLNPFYDIEMIYE